VEAVLNDLYRKGDIYKGIYSGLYCTPCERFFMEKDLVKGLCPECERNVEAIKEENYFFAMSKYRQWLIDYIDKNPCFIRPEFRRNETLGFLHKGLSDLCISRPKKRLSWGIELPFDPDYVCYVWFDALINYISAIGYKSDDRRFSHLWGADYHLIGKDILTTHTVYWPTMLRAIGIEQPGTIFAHGWWLMDGGKISKSKGNAVDPLSLLDKYGADAFRYFLMADMSLGQDAAFSEKRFVARYNSDLANNLGNLVNRIIRLIDSCCKGIVPGVRNDNPYDKKLRDEIIEIAGAVENDVAGLRIDIAVTNILKGCSLINQYLENTEPWKLKKNRMGKERLGDILGNSTEALRIVSGLLYPVIPEKIVKLGEWLGFTGDEKIPTFGNLKNWGGLLKGKKVKTGKVLFPRIEQY
jgi:methionyl-tRNA synthetase